jgi:hypothetical protein
MSKFTEETLTRWTKPPSDTEKSKLENAERMVREAINQDEKLKSKSIEIFGQGSYANNTNVRVNSDIDINVQYTDGFYYDLAEGETVESSNIIPHNQYSYKEFKNDVEQALINKFGYSEVLREDKCINIKENSYRVKTDVVPTWEYRRYNNKTSYELGARFFTDNGNNITNYPKQHIQNGKNKNTQTARRFKRLTRLHRKLRYKMIEDNINISSNITSFLLECLIWNVPNNIFNDPDTWNNRLKQSIIYIYQKTNTKDGCSDWGEVSELLYLFVGKKWSHSDVNNYMQQLWNYLEYK